MKIVAVDLGGTHARFAIAELHGDGRRPTLSAPRKYRTADHPGLPAAWAAFARDEGSALPQAASIAIAGPVEGELIRFTNNSWVIHPTTLGRELGLEDLCLFNDFAAMAAAVGVMLPKELAYIGGPEGPLPLGVTTVVGPGTGLGVAQLIRRPGQNIVLATEGGHIDFAPLDGFEERLLARLRERHRRVSVERVVSGPALADIRATLAMIAGDPIVPLDDGALWQAATEGSDAFAVAALDRFVMAFGAVSGDLALAHGANAVVITGGLANRIEGRLRSPLFNDRFRAKGRFERRMADFPIRLARHPEAGLLGAAAAFQEERRP